MTTQTDLPQDVDGVFLELHRIRDGGGLPMFTITDHPRDYPEHFVARLHVIAGTASGVQGFAILETDLNALRKTMRDLGLVRLERAPSDDSVIVETWI